MGILLRSNKACQTIIKSIVSDTRHFILCQPIVKGNLKLSVLVDESTNIGGKSCMVIHRRAMVNKQPAYMLLDAVELPNTEANKVAETILPKLAHFGFGEEYC